MRRGFLDLVAIPWPAGVCLQTLRGMDWASRKVLAWRLSNTMEVDFCVEALVDETLERHGPPEIFNTDQGSQFTSFAFTSVLKDAGSRSRWTAAAAGWTISLSNGSGAR